MNAAKTNITLLLGLFVFMAVAVTLGHGAAACVLIVAWAALLARLKTETLETALQTDKTGSHP